LCESRECQLLRHPDLAQYAWGWGRPASGRRRGGGCRSPTRVGWA